jgi:hypothetical protein
VTAAELGLAIGRARAAVDLIGLVCADAVRTDRPLSYAELTSAHRRIEEATDELRHCSWHVSARIEALRRESEREQS